MVKDVVEVKYTPGEYKTWDTADSAWESIRSTKPWDDFGNKGVLTINIQEGFGLSDSLGIETNINFREKFFINDFKFEPSNIVLTDLNFVEDIYNEEELGNLSGNISPLDYDPTRPLFPGEYTYQDAIVGIQMRSSLSGDRLGFYQAKLNVDVQDVVARGTVEVTSTDESNPTRVPYYKKYYLPPEELMFHVTAATEPAYVKVLSKTDTYFDIVLVGNTSGNLVTGTVSWVSTGY